MRETTTWTILLATVLSISGCTPTARDPAEPARLGAWPASQPARAVMAYVNEEPVYMEELVDLLLRGPAKGYARQLVRRQLVRQEMQRRKLTVTDAEVDAEVGRILKNMVPDAKSDRDRRSVLDRLLDQRQISPKQWMLSVRTAAELRKLAEPRVKITDELLRSEFGLRYGRQVVVRDIEVAALTKAQEILRKIEAGEDFAKLAWKHSIADTASNGGLRPAIGPRTKNVAEAVRQAALSLKKTGEISDLIQAEQTFHILKLERVIEPKGVKFEDVRDRVERAVREDMIRYHQKVILDKLTRAAKIEYINQVLRHRMAEGPQP